MNDFFYMIGSSTNKTPSHNIFFAQTLGQLIIISSFNMICKCVLWWLIKFLTSDTVIGQFNNITFEFFIGQ